MPGRSLRQLFPQPFTYPYAGRRAPRPVQAAIAIFRRLPLKYRRRQVLLYWLLGSGTQPYKMTKEESDYRLHPVQGEKCGNCRFAYKNMSHGYLVCSSVQGDIQSGHWCRLWAVPGRPMESFPPGQALFEWTGGQ